MNSEGLLAVTDQEKECVHLFSTEGALVRSIGEGVLGIGLFGVAFDLNGNVWVTDWDKENIVQLSQDGRVLQTIDVGRKGNSSLPLGLSVSPESLIYMCDRNNHYVSVHDTKGKLLFMFGSQESGPGCFNEPCDIAFGSDGLVYVTDTGNRSVCVWSKDGMFLQRAFQTKYIPDFIAATSDNHLLITSHKSNTVMVYTLGGQLVHEFGGTSLGRFKDVWGICVGDNGLVYVAVTDSKNRYVVVVWSVLVL